MLLKPVKTLNPNVCSPNVKLPFWVQHVPGPLIDPDSIVSQLWKFDKIIVYLLLQFDL